MAEKKRTVKRLLSLINRAESRKRKAIQDCKGLESELFETCTHPKEEVLEGEYKQYQVIDGCLRPFRVCKLCGYTEEGWHCGYFKLNYRDDDILHVKREEAARYVRKTFTQDDLAKIRFK